MAVSEIGVGCRGSVPLGPGWLACPHGAKRTPTNVRIVDQVGKAGEKKAGSRKVWGLYFDKWRAMEGSVVGLGADPQAVMRWANDAEAPEAVREFWRGQVPTAQLGGVLDNVRATLRSALEAGVDADEIEALVGDLDTEEPDESLVAFAEILERIEGVEASVEKIDALVTRLDAVDTRIAELAKPQTIAIEEQPEREATKPGDPLPPTMEPREMFAALKQGLAQARVQSLEKLRAEIDRARGKVKT